MLQRLILFGTACIFLSPSCAWADLNYGYRFNLPTIVNGSLDYSQTFEEQLSSVGPFSSTGSAGFCPLYCGPFPIGSEPAPEPAYFPNGLGANPSGAGFQVSFAFYGEFFLGPGPGHGLPCGSFFAGCSFDTITYVMTEPDAFWATLGQHTFDNAQVDLNVDMGSGPVETTLECTGCEVNVFTPEPGYLAPLVISLCMLSFKRRRANGRGRVVPHDQASINVSRLRRGRVL